MKIFGDLNDKKINDKRKLSSRGKGEGGSTAAEAAEGGSFQKLFSLTRRNVDQERIKALLGDIDRHGENLGNAPSLKQFQEYKNAVSRFLKLVLPNVYDISKTTSLNPANLSTKEYHTVQVVNRELESLLKMLHDKEQQKFKYAAAVVRVKGLLLDIVK